MYPIETERLILRPLESEDLTALVEELDSHEDVWEFDPGYRRSFEERRYWLQVRIGEFGAGTGNDGFFARAIVLKENQKLIGIVGMVPILLPERLFPGGGTFHSLEAEIFYSLGRTHWGSGFVTEAVEAILRFGFSSAGLKRIIARTRSENERSISVLKRIGMQPLPERILHRDKETMVEVWMKQAPRC